MTSYQGLGAYAGAPCPTLDKGRPRRCSVLTRIVSDGVFIKLRRSLGNIKTTTEEVLRAKYRKAERNQGQKWMNPKRKKGVKSVRTTSGGTPGSGKRK